MALVNGGVYFLLDDEEYTILRDECNGIYNDYLGYFKSVRIGNVTYWYAPHGSFNPHELSTMFLTDGIDQNDSVTLSAGTYWSGYGFTETGF